MICLRKFAAEDADCVQCRIYPNMTIPQIQEMILQWNAGIFDGKRFEMFAITLENEPVGTVSLYEQTDDCASFGIEVAECFRCRGIAAESGSQVLHLAAQMGYSKVISQVRRDNAASVALHKKLGFVLTEETVNRKGNPVYLYEKCI